MLAPVASALLALPLVQDPEIPSREVGQHSAAVTHLVASEDGRFLYTSTARGQLHAFDLKKGERVWERELDLPLVGLDVGEDWLVYTFGQVTVTQISIEDGADGKSVGGPNVMDNATCITGDSKDRWVWIGTKQGALTRLNPGNVNGWSKRAMKNGGIRSLGSDPKEKLLAVGGEDHTIRFVNPKSASRDEKKVFEGHEAPVTALAFDAKGSTLYSGCENGVLRVWKASNGKELHVLEEHGAAIERLAADAKGRWLASGDADGRIVLWDAKKLEKRAELEGDGGVKGLVFLGKSAELAATTADRVTVWDLSEL